MEALIENALSIDLSHYYLIFKDIRFIRISGATFTCPAYDLGAFVLFCVQFHRGSLHGFNFVAL